MSQFKEKVFAACAKKEALFDESLGRYALRSMLAGAYLTMSTAVGIIGADVIAVSTKLGKTDWMNFTEGITANMFVNIAILGYMLLKEESAKIFIALSAIFMFVFLINEHLIANFASFMLLGFNGVRDAVDNFTLTNILRQWIVVFFGNWIGGGIFIGLAYSWLNKTKTPHID